MHGAADGLVAQHRDHPLDFAPAAEVDEIADHAAAMRPDRRLRRRVLAEPGDEIGRVGQGFPAAEMNVVAQCLSSLPFPLRVLASLRCQTDQRGRLTPDKSTRLCHGRGMSTGRYKQAGGFILALSILAGTVAGVALHQPSIGFLVGLGAGVLLALLVWVVDR